MNRAIVGLYDPHASDDHTRAVLGRALEPDGGAQIIVERPLAVAWTGPPPEPVPESRPLLLLNGEIYNLEALAEEVGAPKGRPAEAVLVTAYERFGESMLPRLRGDFVVLVWERRAGRLLVARDQVNGRSLYVHAAGSRLAFGSEVRNVLRLLPRRPSPDLAAVGHWLAHNRVPLDRTLYEGVSRLEAGHLLQIADGRLIKRRYWRPSRGAQLDGSRAELAAELRAAIAGSVRARCREEETSAVMLSGGLDSSSLAAVSTRLLEPSRAPVGTYSATFPEHPDSDESPQIDVIAPTLGVPNTRIAVSSGGVLVGSLEYLKAWDLPPHSFTLFFWLPLARRAAEDGVSVVLDGENGDDLFGDSPWLVADLIRRGHPLAAARLLRRMPELHGSPWQSLLRWMYIFGVKGSLPRVAHRLMRHARAPGDYAPSWFDARTARAYFETADYWTWKRNGVPLWWANRVETLLTGEFPAGLYDHARRRAAMVGLDRRHPFADVDLIQFVHRLPPELAFERRFTRPLLRESMAGLVPDEVRLRPIKTSLDEIFQDSLLADLPVVRERLLGNDAEVCAYVRPEALRELLEPPSRDPTQSRIEWAVRLWRILEVECWLRFQERPELPDELLDAGVLRKPRYRFVKVPPGAPGARHGVSAAV